MNSQILLFFSILIFSSILNSVDFDALDRGQHLGLKMSKRLWNTYSISKLGPMPLVFWGLDFNIFSLTWSLEMVRLIQIKIGHQFLLLNILDDHKIFESWVAIWYVPCIRPYLTPPNMEFQVIFNFLVIYSKLNIFC